MSVETRCHQIGYSFRLAARILLYASSHRHDNTYHGLCYTNRGALAGTRNSPMGPLHEGSIQRSIAPWANALTTELHLAPIIITIIIIIHCCFSFSMSTPWRRLRNSDVSLGRHHLSEGRRHLQQPPRLPGWRGRETSRLSSQKLGRCRDSYVDTQ